MKNHPSLKTIIISLVVTTSLLFTAGFLNDTGISKKIGKKLAAYSRDHLTERLYLHLDKDLVLPGELLWFKAYRFNPNPEIINEKSNILTLELWNGEGERKLKQYFEIKDGSSSGSLVVPDTIHAGDYILTAYTESMKACGSDSYYRRPLFIRDHARELFLELECFDSLYAAGSKVRTRIRVTNELNQPLGDIPITYRVEAAGSKFAKGEGKTNEQGILEVAFTIPKDTSRHPIILKAQTDFRGHVETKRLVIPTST